MDDLYSISQKILEESDGGLNIILDLFPHADTKKAFKLRNERTASCNLKKLPDNNWVVTDFGADSKPKNAIMLYAEEKGFSWSEAVLILAREYHVPTGSEIKELQPGFKTYPVHSFDKELNEDGFHIETTDKFTKDDLIVLGPYVSDETCKNCNCYKVISYAFKSKKDGKDRIIEISSTDHFPIFAFVNKVDDKEFYKIYQPKSQNKEYRFSYFGGRPSDFINGMERLTKQFNKNKDKYNEILNDDSIADKDKPKGPEKIDKVLICSGERDSLNATSLGYFVLWHNSETAHWSGQIMKKVFDMAEEIIFIPDIDTTGIKVGKATAMKYMSAKTLWLPSWLLKKKDWRGKPRKDLTDYFLLKRAMSKMEFSKHFKKMIESSYPLQFWNERYTDNGIRYDISNTLLYNFLQHNGFYRYEDPGQKSGSCFIKIEDHKVEKIEVEKVYGFIKFFMTKRNLPVALKDVIINSTKVSEQKLSWMDLIDLNFKNSDATRQIMSFSHVNWLINSKEIIDCNDSGFNSFIWDKEILDSKISKEREIPLNPKKIEIEEPYFKISKKESGEYDIDVLEKDCDIFNFVINTSRIHWKEEFIDSWIEEGQNWEDAYEQEDNIKYRKENKTTIAGPRLSSTFIEEQKQHLVNKIFAIGYMLHTYKNAGKPWALYCMENGVVDDEESKGGTGKSLIAKALSYVSDTKYLPARNKDLFSNQFIYDGVTEHTNIIWFDDADRYFKLSQIYSEITGPLLVNPKFGTPYTIPFDKSPKILISSNYSLRDSDPSTLRRLLFVAFSDYFHVASDDMPGNTPDMVFGKQLFQDWDDYQWNKFFNFMAQCIQFYLSCDEKINPPMDQLNQRNLIAQIGPVFMDWADEFFQYLVRNEKGEVEFEKIASMERLKTNKVSLSKITSNKFMKKLKDYCKLNGYEILKGQNSANRLQKDSLIEMGKKVDWILIKTNDPNDFEAIDYENNPF